jgi:hypothetical protein
MSFKYSDVQTLALIDLADPQGANDFYVSALPKIINDVVIIMNRRVGEKNPELIWKSFAVNLTAATGYGPYALPNADPTKFETPVMLLDENQRPIGDSFRGEQRVGAIADGQRQGKPTGYWIEGDDPANLYVNSVPTTNYAWVLYYIATIARQADLSQNVPLPNFCQEAIVSVVVKFAAMGQEYATQDEDQKIAVVDGSLGTILRKRRAKFKLKVKGVGF